MNGNILLDPNIAYILLVGGFLLGFLALFTPGSGILEMAAIALLILAGYGALSIPIAWWALVILVLSVIPFIMAIYPARGFRKKETRWGMLILTIIAVTFGSINLFRTLEGMAAVNPVLAAILSVLTISFLGFIGIKSIQAIVNEPSHSLENLIGTLAQARSDIFTTGTVYIDGEEWSARSHTPIKAGSWVRIVERQGLLLLVKPEE